MATCINVDVVQFRRCWRGWWILCTAAHRDSARVFADAGLQHAIQCHLSRVYCDRDCIRFDTQPNNAAVCRLRWGEARQHVDTTAQATRRCCQPYPSAAYRRNTSNCRQWTTNWRCRSTSDRWQPVISVSCNTVVCVRIVLYLSCAVFCLSWFCIRKNIQHVRSLLCRFPEMFAARSLRYLGNNTYNKLR